MKNKIFITASFITVILAIFFFIFYSFILERPFTIPLKNFFSRSNTILNNSDTLRIQKINKIAFETRLTYPLRTIDLADSALRLAKAEEYIKGIGEAYRIKGIGHFYLNDNEKAIQNYLNALDQFRIINDLKNQARVYNNIGRLYSEIDYNKSLEYYNKSLKISNKLKDEELNSALYFNMASIFQAKANFKKALIYYNQSNKIFESRKDTLNMIVNSFFTGTVYFQLKDYREAELRIKKAIEGSIKKKLYPTLIDSYTCLSKIYLERGLFKKAEENINLGFEYSKKLENKRYLYDLLHAAFQLEIKRNNNKKAIKHLSQIHRYDSLQLSKNQSENIAKTAKNHLQQQKIEENELIIEQSKYKETFFWWTITVIVLLILFTALAGIGTYLVFQKIRKRKDLQIENQITTLEQKTLQGMMNPHFIFNVLNTLQYFICQDDSKEANKILTFFAKLMRKHLEICLKSSITLTEEIEYLQLYLSLEKIRFNEKMDYKVNIEEHIDTEEIILPPLFIQPFVENAIWHGIIPKKEKGTVSLNFSVENDELHVKISDDGVGIFKSKTNKSSNHISRGLELIHERVKLLNKLNTRKISVGKIQPLKIGTEIKVSFPV